jgi:ABC-type oligopeptide transport system substrate-binding subunit
VNTHTVLHFVANPDTFNQWTYQDSISADVLSWALGALYYLDINNQSNGFTVRPDMASTLPAPVNATTLPTGVVVSRTWRIPVRPGLKFQFHPDTNISSFASGHDDITAQTFVETFELALTNKWFRAVSGGSSFMGTSTTSVLNAEQFSNNLVPFSDVGIKVVNGNEIEFTFIDLQSEWNVKYWLSSFVMTPIHIPLYNALGGVNGTYGTSATTTAYTGPMYIDVYEADNVIRLRENPRYHAPERYFFTGVNFRIITDPALRFQEFLAGRLDEAGVPAARFEEFRNDPRIRRAPGATTFRLNFNAAGTVAAMEDQWEVAGKGNVPNFVPEPILASRDFRQAMYFAVDRERLAREILRSAEPQPFHFSSAYLIEPELGINFRGTTQGVGVNADFSPATFGYNFDAARALFDQALEPLVANGTYRSGDVITLTYVINAGSAFDRLTFEFLQDQWADIFNSSRFNIRVELELIAAPFPQNYFNYIIAGTSDLGTGGISGSTLNASSFLSVYRYDNAGGFTLNWGMDTRDAVIPVVYQIGGQTRRELWSYDAIHRALNGEVYLFQGRESLFPTVSNVAANINSVTFNVNEFANPAYRSIRYTIQQGGVDVPGLINVPVTTRTNQISNLLPNTDYSVRVSFQIISNNRVETTLSSFRTLSVDGSGDQLNNPPTPELIQEELVDEVNTSREFKPGTYFSRTQPDANGIITFVTVTIDDYGKINGVLFDDTYTYSDIYINPATRNLYLFVPGNQVSIPNVYRRIQEQTVLRNYPVITDTIYNDDLVEGIDNTLIAALVPMDVAETSRIVHRGFGGTHEHTKWIDEADLIADQIIQDQTTLLIQTNTVGSLSYVTNVDGVTNRIDNAVELLGLVQRVLNGPARLTDSSVLRFRSNPKLGLYTPGNYYFGYDNRIFDYQNNRVSYATSYLSIDEFGHAFSILLDETVYGTFSQNQSRPTTKLILGDQYGLSNVSPINSEWITQAAAYQTAILRNQGIDGFYPRIGSNSEFVDQVAGTTINVLNLNHAIRGAFEAASNWTLEDGLYINQKDNQIMYLIVEDQLISAIHYDQLLLSGSNIGKLNYEIFAVDSPVWGNPSVQSLFPQNQTEFDKLGISIGSIVYSGIKQRNTH